jgi:hypothetical protein
MKRYLYRHLNFLTKQNLPLLTLQTLIISQVFAQLVQGHQSVGKHAD